jgi:hypothetical protein
MVDRSLFVDINFEGYEFSDADLDALRDAFDDIGPLHVSGGWAPAAIPPATIQLVLTVIGEALVGVTIEKVVEAVVRQTSLGWQKYKAWRATRGQTPELTQFVLRFDDFDVEVNGSIDDIDALLDVVLLVIERRANGALRNLPIRRVTLPSNTDDAGWRVVEPPEYAESGDYYVWYVESREAVPTLGFYDARRDQWLTDGAI